MLVGAVFVFLAFAIVWKVFVKAGRPGWEGIVPIYNGWVLVTEICKLEPLIFILSLIPFVNLYAHWVMSQELAKKFGKSEGFGVGLFFLGIIFMAILAFGDAEYVGGRRRDDYYYDDDDEDERPRKKRRVDDDDDDDDRPRKKRRYDDE
jgi:hypothetical protein